MIPHSDALMISTPLNPEDNPLNRLFNPIPEAKKYADITFTQTRRPRPFLKSLRLRDEGSCCPIAILSKELQEI